MSVHDDAAELEKLGYSQELSRGMNAFSNFAMAFSVICILAGGITSLPLGISSVGGASVGLGWPFACFFSVCTAMAMGQIASAFPTAGGLYHWASVLGGRAAGWVTAWLNLVGLVTVLAAINVGVFLFVVGALGWKPAAWVQPVVVLAIVLSQGLLNHRGIRLTSALTDASGYLIMALTFVLVASLLYFAPSHELGRLFKVENFSGAAGGSVWPANPNVAYVFLLGLLLPAYTITGFDASANTAEETVGAGLTVPKAMVSAVISSSFFGGLMLAAVVLAMPSVAQGAAQGGSVFFWTLQQVLPDGLRLVLLVGIALCQYLCGLATLTSASRMVYAFARDGGLPGSSVLRQVSQVYLTPVFAIWAVALFSWAFTLETQVYSTITAVCTIFLYSSYVFPIFLGLLAFRRSWTQMGPWDLGQGFRVVACLAVLANCGLLFIGCQPPNQKTLPITLGFLALMACIWFGYERRRFRGPAMLRGIES